ncbi:hypothetical protein K0M31_019762 [Melipona bicolor]|uniref:Uncharacterized protein n=1 Tax=Melipona bicolor TaxID=60889 RepID=A0AA40KRH8_9HYME|nr:hypothetical protein K0M31_019762 [Melipona bicolor]
MIDIQSSILGYRCKKLRTLELLVKEGERSGITSQVPRPVLGWLCLTQEEKNARDPVLGDNEKRTPGQEEVDAAPQRALPLEGGYAGEGKKETRRRSQPGDQR